jgi:O-antigen ligase
MALGSTLLDLSWYLLLLFLPVTSFPFLSKLFGETLVAPLSFIPVIIIFLLWWIPSFLKNKKGLPHQLKPLFLFILFGVISTLIAFYRPIPSFRDIPWLRNAAEFFVTIGFGICFYLVTIFVIKDVKKLQKTILWISIGGIILILYSWIQFGSWLMVEKFPTWLQAVQSLVSANGKLYEQRATGFALEPSWLAHQLNMIYIPLWLGLSVSRQSIFTFKIFKKIMLEDILLLLGVVTLFISFSRIGWITFIISAAYVVFRFANKWIESLSDKRSSKDASYTSTKKFLFKTGIWTLLAFSLVGVLLVAGVILTKIDPRMENLFDIERFRQFGFLGWASRLGFAERIIYWLAAFHVYQMFPLFGAGLGLPGYHFPATVPDFGSRLPEINKALFTQNFIPNAKNLWVRLLSETGIIGFALFISWLVVHWRDAVEIEKTATQPLIHAMGLIGKLIIIAMIIEGFSLDTFGLPYYWIGLGLITASWFMKGHSEKATRVGENMVVNNPNNA